MENVDVVIINLYLLSIFTILAKTKTIVPIYRIFKLFNITLFVYIFILIFTSNVEVVDTIIKMIPLVLLMVIIVQTEFLLILKKLGFKKSVLFSNSLEDKIKIELVKSIDHLSNRKIGAIITLEKNTSMEEFIENAFQVNAPLTNELLSTIFYPATPLHDGAVIIKNNQIVCAGAYYPPTEKLDVPKSLGSRHRAAIGVSEISDSLTIVVSEQTGNVSVAYNGYLDLNINKEALLRYLKKHLQT